MTGNRIAIWKLNGLGTNLFKMNDFQLFNYAAALQNSYSGAGLNTAGTHIVLESPSILSLYSGQRDRTIRFIQHIYQVAVVDRAPVEVSFRYVERLGTSAAVMIFGEITAVQITLEDANAIKISLPEDKEVLKTFHRYEFYKAIKPGGLRKLRDLLEDDCYFQSGFDAPKHCISAILALGRSGAKLTAPEIKIFQTSILEAFLNVKHHSYPEDYLVELKRWWQFTYYDSEDGSLHFVVYDRGRTIPATIKDFAKTNYNAGKLIEYAMKYRVTSTGNANRGKGSDNIKLSYRETDNSSLLIYSGDGIYFLDKEDDTRVTSSDNPYINGTIIEWQIPYSIEKR